MEHHDVHVVIVGSGPAGSAAALELLRLPGWERRRIVILEKASHPRVKPCAGGVTALAEAVLARLRLPLAVPSVEVAVADFLLPSVRWRIQGRPLFRVVDRTQFDAWLASEARCAGAELHERQEVRSVSVEQDEVTVSTAGHCWHAQAVIAADGANSRTRRLLGIRAGSAPARLIETIAPASGTSESAAWPPTIFDFRRAGGELAGYCWRFPSLAGPVRSLNIGVYDSSVGGARSALRPLLNAAAREFGHGGTGRVIGHTLQGYTPRGPVSHQRVVFAGDAAGADLMLGEGISFALAYGRLAAEAIDNACRRRDFGFRSYRASVSRDPAFRRLWRRNQLARSAYPAARLAPLLVQEIAGAAIGHTTRRAGLTSTRTPDRRSPGEGSHG